MDVRRQSRLIPEPRRVDPSGDDSPARSLWRFVWRMSGLHQVLVCALATVVAGLSMAPLELQRRIVNQAVEAAETTTLFLLGGIYLGVALLSGALKYLLRVYQSWLSESAVNHLRQHLTRLHREKAGSNGEHHEGRAVAIIGREVDQLGGFVGEGLSELVAQGGMLVAVLGYMFVTEPWLAAIAAVFLLPQVILTPLVQRVVNRLLEGRIALQRRLGDMIARIGPGETDSPGTRALETQIGRVYRNRMQIFAWKFAGKSGVNLLNSLAPLAALVAGGYMVIQGDTSLGVVVAFLSGFDRLADPIRQLLSFYRLAAQANVQHHKIAQWM